MDYQKLFDLTGKICVVTGGSGYLGTEALSRITRHPALRHLPFCLETPNELPGYQAEIALLRELWR